jgi:hypothetical protein
MAASSAPETVPISSIADRILEALHQRPMTAVDLARQSKAGDSASTAITRLLRQGRIERGTDQKYRLAPGTELRNDSRSTEPLPEAVLQQAYDDAHGLATPKPPKAASKPPKIRPQGEPCKRCGGTEKYKDGSCAPCARGRAATFHQKERDRKQPREE